MKALLTVILLLAVTAISAQQSSFTAAMFAINEADTLSASAFEGPMPLSDDVTSADTISKNYSDTIITTTGESIVCRVLEISSEIISFSLDSVPEQIFVLASNSIFMIRYANGTNDLGVNIVGPDYYAMGKQDGNQYYKTGAVVAGSVASGVTAWFIGIGVIPEVVIVATNPKRIHNKANPNDHLLTTNQEYYDGYMQSARRKKITRSTIGFFSGAALIPMIFFAALAL